MAEITVLLPIYNGSAYLDQTLSSLARQSFEDFEVLCIDDCSTDDSADIICLHAARDKRFIHLHTGTNLGTAARAVNFAAPSATGNWFVYSSQDDLFSEDWLQKLHTRRALTGANAVLPDVVFYRENASSERRITGYLGDHTAQLTGREAFIASLDWTISGYALWPMSFLKENGFFDFGAFADEYTVRSYFLACTRVAFCDSIFFYRQDNANAITKKPQPGRLDEAHNNLMIWRLALKNGFEPQVHGPFALRTLQSVIRARALIFNTPSLAGEAPRIEGVWRDLQSDRFRSSLEMGVSMKCNRVLGAAYLRTHISYGWFICAARLSSAISSVKNR